MKKIFLIILICLIILVIASAIIGVIYKDKFFEESPEKETGDNSPKQDWTGYTTLYDATDKAVDDFLEK